MKKSNIFVVLLLSLFLTLAGCQGQTDSGNQSTEEEQGTAPEEVQKETESKSSEQDEPTQEEAQSLSATIELVDVQDEVVTSKTVEFESGDVLMDVLRENFEVVEAKGFITEVETLAPDEEKQEFISITVNGEMAMTGANEIVLEEGDEVTFSIEVWE